MSDEQFNPESPCRLCGGTTGGGCGGGAHELCKAREERGLSTPCLGRACGACGGSGHEDRAAVPGASPGFFLDGSGDFERHLEARFPACPVCRGARVEPGSAEGLHRGA